MDTGLKLAKKMHKALVGHDADTIAPVLIAIVALWLDLFPPEQREDAYEEFLRRAEVMMYSKARRRLQ